MIMRPSSRASLLPRSTPAPPPHQLPLADVYTSRQSPTPPYRRNGTLHDTFLFWVKQKKVQIIVITVIRIVIITVIILITMVIIITVIITIITTTALEDLTTTILPTTGTEASPEAVRVNNSTFASTQTIHRIITQLDQGNTITKNFGNYNNNFNNRDSEYQNRSYNYGHGEARNNRRFSNS